MPSTASANRDESVFPHADQRRRRTAPTSSSSASATARTTASVRTWRASSCRWRSTSLFDRFPDLRLAVPADEVPWKDGSVGVGPRSPPALFLNRARGGTRARSRPTRWWWSPAAARASARRPPSVSPRKARGRGRRPRRRQRRGRGRRDPRRRAAAPSRRSSTSRSTRASRALIDAAVDEFGGVDFAARQRRRHDRGRDPERHRRGRRRPRRVRPHHRGEPARLPAVHPPRDPAHARARWRRDRVHQLGHRARRRTATAVVRDLQERHQRAHASRVGALGPRGHPRELRRTGHGAHARRCSTTPTRRSASSR